MVGREDEEKEITFAEMFVSLRTACPPLGHRTVHCVPQNKRSLTLQSCLVLSQRRHKGSHRLFLCLYLLG